ncbi:MAG: PEP-utilizing enzyme, partial [Myxococcota bacterium]|nr:PEP-utilizing enzyme [Myxococcota bacterium]
VRTALLRRARELAIPEADVFWLAFEELAGPLAPEDAHRRAGAARAASARAARWAMPPIVDGVVGGDAPDSRRALHGVGTGPRVTGRVVRFRSLASAVAVGPGDVIVTRAITPALAVFVVGCAAIVSETGGPLDHGAAMARELGIPCVVGCRDAWSLLTDGSIVTVDGAAGRVTTPA